jgi:hypothetical protein
MNLTDDDSQFMAETLNSKAHLLFVVLQETGWIDVSMDPDTFEETVVLPQYTIVYLRAINEIIGDETAPYLSLVHSTYSELKLEDESPDELFICDPFSKL